MRTIQRILHCRKDKRCGYFLSCKHCGEAWRRRKFCEYCDALPKVLHRLRSKNDNPIITYIVIRSNQLLNLKDSMEQIYKFIDYLREEKKRGRLPISYGRLEVSFSKSVLGFNPHLNLIAFENADFFKVAEKYWLKIWYQNKEFSEDVAKSIAWYILKFNNLGIEKGEAVRRAINKRNTIIYSKDFTPTKRDYIEDFLYMDFSFLGIERVRTPEELELRDRYREIRRKINIAFKRELELIRGRGESERGEGE